MTTEEKAKRYDEAIEIAKEINNEQRAQPFNVMTRVFPELAESEDEMMVKFIKNQLFNIKKTITENYELDAKLTKAIDWLEKQGEQKHIDKIQLGKKYKCIASPRYSTFMIGNIYKPEDKFLCSLMNFCSYCFESIEDGEQKPAWTEKDEEYLNDVIQTLRNFAVTGGSEAKRYTEEKINWLKSKCK